MTKTNSNITQIVHAMNSHPKSRTEIFLQLSSPERTAILHQLTRRTLSHLLTKLKDEEIVSTLDQLDPDEATDIIQILDNKRQKKIIESLGEELRESVKVLTEFDPQTAAGFMNIDYIQVDTTDQIMNVAKKFKTHEKRTGRLPAIIVVHNGKLAGYLPGHQLGFAKPQEIIKRHVRHIQAIQYNTAKIDVLKIFREHPHNKMVVLGKEGQVLGVIYSDDILRVLEGQESASLYNFAGVHDEESVFDTVRHKVKYRYKWLIINLATAFLASFTVSLFDETISKYVLLAVYMPIVAGMGGNAATQTLAVMVRGISLRQINLDTFWLTLKRELGSGLINGVINAIIVALIVLIFNHDVRIALILGFAMITNLIVASFFGTLVPLIMKRLGKDPATSATIFITTATDVLGFLAFLGLATAFLR